MTEPYLPAIQLVLVVVGCLPPHTRDPAPSTDFVLKEDWHGY